MTNESEVCSQCSFDRAADAKHDKDRSSSMRDLAVLALLLCSVGIASLPQVQGRGIAPLLLGSVCIASFLLCEIQWLSELAPLLPLLCPNRKNMHIKGELTMCSSVISEHSSNMSPACLEHASSLLEQVREQVREQQVSSHHDDSSSTSSDEEDVPVGVVDVDEHLSEEQCQSLPTFADFAYPATGVHKIRIEGELAQVKATCKSLRKHGFVNKLNDENFPLNGHWETPHGLVVGIEKKVVRWSPKRASKLKFTRADKCSCSLSLYGETVKGRMVRKTGPDEATQLRWDNGDVWWLLDGCRIGGMTVSSPSISKAAHNDRKDDKMRLQAAAIMSSVSTQGMCLPNDCYQQVLSFIGDTSYFVHVQFDCQGSLDFLADIAQLYPKVVMRNEYTKGYVLRA